MKVLDRVAPHRDDGYMNAEELIILVAVAVCVFAVGYAVGLGLLIAAGIGFGVMLAVFGILARK